MLKELPVSVFLREDQIKKLDLLKELHIDRHSLDKELSRQPGKYAWWAMLLSELSRTVEELKARRDRMEARLYLKYKERGYKQAEIKHHITLNEEYQQHLRKLRDWDSAEANLKAAEKAFYQRGSILQSLAANQRKDKEQS